MLAISNPSASGGGYRRDMPRIMEALANLGYEVEVRHTTAPGDAAEFARRAVAESYQLVCAIGGDGTVNEVVNGLAGSEVPLAIVPTGTVNVLAMELGVPLDPPDAVGVIEKGSLSWIDLGLAGDRYFALMAGIGMDARTVASINPILKKTLKEAAFAVQGAVSYFTHEEPLLRVECEEQTVEGYFAVFGNASNYGGAFGITPFADMRDGLLDVCVLKDKSFLGTAWYWLAALINSHINHPKVAYFRTQVAQVSAVDADQEVLVQTDGEVAGKLPIACRVVPRALRVIVP
jgi:YegS/Rv2252/BmrU family lipid kinase